MTARGELLSVLVALDFAQLAACGGRLIDAGDSAARHQDADASSDTPRTDDATSFLDAPRGETCVAAALMPDGALPTSTQCLPTIDAFCAQPGVPCPRDWPCAQAECATYGAITESPCGQYRVFVLTNQYTTIAIDYYYSVSTDQLAGIVVVQGIDIPLNSSGWRCFVGVDGFSPWPPGCGVAQCH